jgi:hypothetical protein
MIELTQIPNTNIVEMEIAGSVSAEEFDRVLAELEEIITQHGSIRVLEIIGTLDTPPIPWSRFWDDIRFGFEHLGDISHAAVVADQGWIRRYVNFLDPLLKPEIKTFKLPELEVAREWLKGAA